MSDRWIQDRIEASFGTISHLIINNYSRHVFLVSPLQASEHVHAMSEIIQKSYVNKPAEAQEFADKHAKHDIEIEFREAHLDIAEKKYEATGKYRRPQNRRR